MEILVVIYLSWGLTVQLIELLKASLKQNWSSQVHLGSSVSVCETGICNYLEISALHFCCILFPSKVSSPLRQWKKNCRRCVGSFVFCFATLFQHSSMLGLIHN